MDQLYFHRINVANGLLTRLVEDRVDTSWWYSDNKTPVGVVVVPCLEEFERTLSEPLEISRLRLSPNSTPDLRRKDYSRVHCGYDDQTSGVKLVTSTFSVIHLSLSH